MQRLFGRVQCLGAKALVLNVLTLLSRPSKGIELVEMARVVCMTISRLNREIHVKRLVLRPLQILKYFMLIKKDAFYFHYREVHCVLLKNKRP
ncbi:unnamed protein product [Phytomonas sp. EM1]|nr:unnamed protein product [Phytomonas sp. EM1]|eukprot:CCW64673.1 unnamed protein product [Phytomonas sp. isolate EM1]